MIGIYIIKNVVNNKHYIGSSNNIYDRWRRHKRALLTNSHHSVALQRAWNKYGKNNFTLSIIEECTEEDLLKREQFFFDLFKPHYNTCKVAGRTSGYKHSEESKSKMSKAKRNMSEQTKEKLRQIRFNQIEEQKKINGKSISDEVSRKISEKSKGRKQSKETIEKRTAKLIGRPVSFETKQKLREHNLGKKHSEETKLKCSLAMIEVRRKQRELE